MTLHLDGIDGLRSGIIFYDGWGAEEKRKVESGKSNRGIEGLMGFSRAATSSGFSKSKILAPAPRATGRAKVVFPHWRSPKSPTLGWSASLSTIDSCFIL